MKILPEDEKSEIMLMNSKNVYFENCLLKNESRSNVYKILKDQPLDINESKVCWAKRRRNKREREKQFAERSLNEEDSG